MEFPIAPAVSAGKMLQGRGTAVSLALCTGAALVAALAFCPQVKGQSSMSILTNSDDIAGTCVPDRQDDGVLLYAGCCSSPGRRSCASGCLNPTSLGWDSYSQASVCQLAAPACDPAITAL